MTESTSLPQEFYLLQECLAKIPDPRRARGKVHPLEAVLSLAVLGLMARCRSLSDISRWGKLHPELVAGLGLRRRPSVATLSRLLRQVSVAAVRRSLLEFAWRLNEGRSGHNGLRVVALDGKTLRGAWENGQQLHLLEAFAHQGALALDQVVVQGALGEVAAAQAWVEQVAQELPGLEILTGDALFAQRDLCQAIVDGHRDYLLKLKKTSGPSMRM